MKIENNFLILYLINFQRKSMFATLQSDINSLKPVLLHLTGQGNFQKGRAKVKDGII
jgi:hypothetical protein